MVLTSDPMAPEVASDSDSRSSCIFFSQQSQKIKQMIKHKVNRVTRHKIYTCWTKGNWDLKDTKQKVLSLRASKTPMK